MSRHSQETIGVRYTGWAALNRDPQEDTLQFICPHCGHRGLKSARRSRAEYHFTDAFVQDTQGEMTACRTAVPLCVSHPSYWFTISTKTGASRPFLRSIRRP